MGRTEGDGNPENITVKSSERLSEEEDGDCDEILPIPQLTGKCDGVFLVGVFGSGENLCVETGGIVGTGGRSQKVPIRFVSLAFFSNLCLEIEDIVGVRGLQNGKGSTALRFTTILKEGFSFTTGLF
jgi:hypothetical protein